MNEIDKFFEGLPKGEEKVEIKEPIKTGDPELDEVPESVKNRRHRRLEQKNREKDEMNLQLLETVKTQAEMLKFKKETNGEIDPRLLQVFGTTDDGKAVAKIFNDVLSETKREAEERAIEKLKAERLKEIEETNKFSEFIDGKLEELEDEHGVDFTSGSPASIKAQKEFLSLVTKLSPKDETGQLTTYADFDSTFELWQQSRTKNQDNSRQKELGNRSMQRSGSADTTKADQDAQLKWLRENGIRV